MSDGSCPYGTVDLGLSTMKGCTLTETKTELRKGSFKKQYMACPSSCRDGPYKRCPVYQRQGGKAK